MMPSIRKGDLLLACRVCGKPQRGDIVLFTSPDAGPLAIRRVVAVPGDRVEVHKGETLVNGKPLDDTDDGVVKIPNVDPVSSLPRPFADSIEKNGVHEYHVLRDLGVALSGDRPPQTLGDEYFVVADRRTLVRDSRDYGPIPRASIRSIVVRVLSAGDQDKERQGKLP
jgi:signal peptidase I